MQQFDGGYWVDCLGRFFNYKEWSRFCEEQRCATDKAVAHYHEFGYNMCDCCLNPLEYVFQGSGYRIRISVAETPRGWVHGITYRFGKGLDMYGGGWAADYDCEIVSGSADLAKLAAFDELLSFVGRLSDEERNILLMLRHENKQLSLF